MAAIHKVLITSIHFEKKAGSWYQFVYGLKEGTSYEEFTQAILIRFLNVEQDDVVGKFNRLHQTNTITDFQYKFEELKPRLLAKNLGLTKEFF